MPSSEARAFRATADGLVIAVRLTPKADRDALGSVTAMADGRAVVQARVRAVPSEGAANAALIVLVARALGVPKSAVGIAAGATQRVKQVAVAGDPAVLEARLNALTGAAK